MRESKPKYQIGEIYHSPKHDQYFEIVNARYVERVEPRSRSEKYNGQVQIHEWLYDVKYLQFEKKYRRYYESRFEEFEKIDKTLAIALFGRVA